MRPSRKAFHGFVAEPGAGAVEDDDQLEDQRRTPDNPDDDVGQGRQGPELGEPAGKAPRFLLPVSQSPEGAHLLMEPKATSRPRGKRTAASGKTASTA